MDREDEIAELKSRLAALEGADRKPGLPPPSADDGTPLPPGYAAKPAPKRASPIFMAVAVVALLASLAAPKLIVSLPLLACAAAAVVSLIRRENWWPVSVLTLVGAGAMFMWAVSDTPSVSGSSDVPEVRAEDVPANLPVTLGRGTREYGRTEYPVVVENLTGKALNYLEARCSFYDAKDQLVATEFTNWTNVAPGERSSGTLRVEPGDVARYECLGKPGI